MANEPTTTSLIINLTNSYEEITKGGGTLHETQLDLLKKRVREIVERSERFGKELENESEQGSFAGHGRRHDVITVHGKRGTGKTTFLLTALTQLQETRSAEGQQDDTVLDGLCVLGIMDPTLFGGHEHLLLTLLGTIAQKVRASKQNRRAPLCDARGSDCAVEKWEKSLENLAEGLKFIGENREDLDSPPTGAVVQWENAAFLMERSMDSACQGLELERHFHKFMHESLKLLGKKAFVLALDDADTRPSIGWHVLEVLRRYFTSPQLVVILSGDMDLFQTIIEKKQWAVFGLNFTSPEKVLGRFQSRVDDLTEQYLLKILRTPARLSLGFFQSALEQWQRRHVNAEIYVSKSIDNKISLDEALKRMYVALGCHAASEQRMLRDTLLRNPIRTVVQVLDCLVGEVYPNLPEHLAERLREVFVVAIQRFGFEDSIDLAETLQTPQGITAIMRRLFSSDAVQVGLELLPTRSEPDVNNALLALQATLSVAMRANTSVLFAYAFKACLLREVLALRGDEIAKTPYFQIARYLALEAQELPSMTAARITALHCGDPATAPLRYRGMIRLYSGSITSNAPIAMKAMYGTDTTPEEENIPDELEEFCKAVKASDMDQNRRKSWINTPKTLQDLLIGWQKDLVALGVVDVRKGGKNFRYFSVFPLLAAMADILVGNWDSLNDILTPYTQIPSVNTFSGQAGFADSFEDDQEGDSSDEQKESPESEGIQARLLQSRFRVWADKSVKKDWLLPPVLCARIMSRFFKALARIDKEMTNDQTFVGVYMHRCLVAFFNSVLVEEFLLQAKNDKSTRVSLEAPTTNDGVFLKNIRDAYALAECKEAGASDKINKDEYPRLFTIHIEGVQKTLSMFNGRFPFFNVVFSFPLWGQYLQPTKMEGDGAARTVYETYMYMQALFFEKEAEDTLEPSYTTVAYGNSDYLLKNLHPVLNSLAKTAGFSTKTVDNDYLNSLFSEKQLTNRKRAKLLISPKKFQSLAVVNDLKKFSPELIYRGKETTSTYMSENFFLFYKHVVELYYPRVREYEHLYRDKQAEIFWKTYCKEV